MKKNSQIPLFLLVIFIGLFSSLTYWIGINQGKILSPESSQNKWSSINVVLDNLLSNYVDSLDSYELSENSINNILKDLDPHSSFIPATKRQSVNESLVGHFGGIGIRFMIYNDTLTIVDVIEGGPSKLAGLKKRDRIIKIEDKNFAGIGIKNEDVLKKLKGKVGSAVNITVLNPNNNIVEHTLLRGSIPLKSITASTILKNNIGYIKLSSFSNSSDLEFKDAIFELKNQGMEKLIFDLRFNGGGYLHQAINISDEFLKEDQLIVYTEGAHSKKRSFYSRSKGLFEEGELIVLVNSSTASASEIVSGALQDNNRGQILGRRTFGKGLVQQPLMLPDSSELRITTSRYYTPSGKCIQKPYGENIDYDNDIFERIESGELTQNDSNYDKSIFKGGILPDIYSPIDTLDYSQAINNIIYTRNWRDFCFSYFEKYPYPKVLNTKDFYKNFKIETKELEKYFQENGKNIGKYKPKEISDLKWSLKIELSSYYFSEQSRYILNTFRDSDVKKAIEEMSN